MNRFVKAKVGNIFVITEPGLEIPRIKAKYEEFSPHKLRYSKTVPEAWVRNGYVKEISEVEK